MIKSFSLFINFIHSEVKQFRAAKQVFLFSSNIFFALTVHNHIHTTFCYFFPKRWFWTIFNNSNRKWWWNYFIYLNELLLSFLPCFFSCTHFHFWTVPTTPQPPGPLSPIPWGPKCFFNFLNPSSSNRCAKMSLKKERFYWVVHNWRKKYCYQKILLI
jgi:hypothetical protein